MVDRADSLSAEMNELDDGNDHTGNLMSFLPKRKSTSTQRPEEIFGKPHDIDPEMAATKEKIKEMLKSMDLDPPPHVIDPRTSKWLNYFDLVAGVALIYVAIMTPLEVAFIPVSGRRAHDGKRAVGSGPSG